MKILCYGLRMYKTTKIIIALSFMACAMACGPLFARSFPDGRPTFRPLDRYELISYDKSKFDGLGTEDFTKIGFSEIQSDLLLTIHKKVLEAPALYSTEVSALLNYNLYGATGVALTYVASFDLPVLLNNMSSMNPKSDVDIILGGKDAVGGFYSDKKIMLDQVQSLKPEQYTLAPSFVIQNTLPGAPFETNSEFFLSFFTSSETKQMLSNFKLIDSNTKISNIDQPGLTANFYNSLDSLKNLRFIPNGQDVFFNQSANKSIEINQEQGRPTPSSKPQSGPMFH